MSAYVIDELNIPIEYVTTDGVHHIFIPMSQRTAIEITQESDPEEYQKDVDGITDPNLHRRIFDEDESITDVTTFTIRGKNSYRYIYNNTHDEDSETEEIP